MLDQMKGEDKMVHDFIESIFSERVGRRLEELHLFTTKEELHNFLYKDDPTSKISVETKAKFLCSFFLMHDYFRFSVRLRDMPIDSAF